MYKAIGISLFTIAIDALSIPPALQLISPPLNETSPAFISEFGAYNTLSACDASIYGVPNVKSCLEVYRTLSSDTKLVEFGERTAGKFQYPLPYRFTSGNISPFLRICVVVE